MSYGLGMRGDEARAFGLIVTLENAGGETLTLHRTGHLLEALRQACKAAIGCDPSYRVVSVSTPTSIYADLQMRLQMGYAGARPATIEAQMLGRAGIRHMLHPRLDGRSKAAAQRNRTLRHGP